MQIIITCKIVSKLKVSPFHSVNSPEEAPVTRRRPSGVQAKQNMGHCNCNNNFLKKNILKNKHFIGIIL